MTEQPDRTNLHESLVRMLRQSGSVRFGRFILSSGGISEVYIDIKRAWTHPDRLEILGHALADRVGDADRLAGMELGAVPLLAATSLYARRPYAVVRKAAKGHGTDQRIEGDLPRGARVLVIEDVTTTGRSVAETVELLRSAGASVDRVLVVVDRNEGAAERLAQLSVSLEALATLEELKGTRS